MNEEVRSLSNQAEKILDSSAAALTKLLAGKSILINELTRVNRAAIQRAAVLAELAKAHALVELADAIRESSFGRNV